MARTKKLKLKNLTKWDKMAIILISLGEDSAANLLKHFPQREVKLISAAMNRIGRIDPEISDELLYELYDFMCAQGYIPKTAQGGNALRDINYLVRHLPKLIEHG